LARDVGGIAAGGVNRHREARKGAALSPFFILQWNHHNTGRFYDYGCLQPTGCTRLDPALGGMFFAFQTANQMRAEGSLRGLTQMNSFSLTAAAAVSLGLLCSPASAGAVFTEATISPSAGGQNTVVGTVSSLGDLSPAGSYFVEIAGLSTGDFSLASTGM
jgi:hypothetical protein